MLRAALVPGGAVVLDGTGQVRLGLSDEAMTGLLGDAPEHVRLAVAYLAASRAVDAGWVDATEETSGGVGVPGTGGRTSEGTDAYGEERRARVIRSGGFLGNDLLIACLRARREGAAVLPLVEAEDRCYVGPLLGPDSRPCVLCLQRAVAPNRKSEGLLEPLAGAYERVWLSKSRLEVTRELSSRPDEILEVHREGRLVGRHHVRTFPDCPVCGGRPIDPNESRPVLEARPKTSCTETGARTQDPRETFEAYRHLISPVSGAVRRIRRVEMRAPQILNVFTASHAMSKRSDSFAALMRDGRDPSGGKGCSSEQARVSALCEALERFSAIATGNESDAVGTLDEVDGAMHPADWLLFSERQYENREQWNLGRSRFHYVPEPFDEMKRIAWSRVWCLQTGAAARLPTAALYYDFQGPGTAYGTADSNGLAAGANLEEAVLQGFLEVVERDAIAMWWYNRLRMPELDVDTFGDAYVGDVREHYGELGRSTWVLDLTSDLGIPVFAALSARSCGGPPEVIFGFGAHLDPSIALRRCVTEMNQMLATVSRPAAERRRRLRGAHDDALRWWREATLEDNPYLLPHPELPPRGRRCFDHVWSDDLRDDIQTCLAVADRHGLATYVRDMTRADLGISVAKVVVPGLRHFWRRLAPGRLYDAPVAMKKLDVPRAEGEMNPISLFV